MSGILIRGSDSNWKTNRNCLPQPWSSSRFQCQSVPIRNFPAKPTNNCSTGIISSPGEHPRLISRYTCCPQREQSIRNFVLGPAHWNFPIHAVSVDTNLKSLFSISSRCKSRKQLLRRGGKMLLSMALGDAQGVVLPVELKTPFSQKLNLRGFAGSLSTCLRMPTPWESGGKLKRRSNSNGQLLHRASVFGRSDHGRLFHTSCLVQNVHQRPWSERHLGWQVQYSNKEKDLKK
ncbi:unnamed protein product [Nesidiocoris tenuis]|uniref:Uncharacterized protein n=1 Tax=Nesidiocoris tenuis TaxID=355587 RepID=A0A6H5GJQ7_9HEMI|nr:unnamed protein product [Nesidiocoris tenuis]